MTKPQKTIEEVQQELAALEQQKGKQGRPPIPIKANRTKPNPDPIPAPLTPDIMSDAYLDLNAYPPTKEEREAWREMAEDELRVNVYNHRIVTQAVESIRKRIEKQKEEQNANK